MNARDSTILGEARLHRMIRRGTSYGPLLPHGVLEDDRADRGIMFAFLGTHLSRQFEFVKTQWVNDGVFLGAPGEHGRVRPGGHRRRPGRPGRACGGGRSLMAADRSPASYRIRILGHLDPVWSAWLDGLDIVQQVDATTTLSGRMTDQAELFGLLARLRDLGATLLAVEALDHEPRPPGDAAEPPEPP
jgi:hypothetical protein